ncbi:hypothetical protein TNCV_4192481 [Trichonephila clavipes]|nr:hypothetical protein TNCV_4192481 [Trichonephila clavipes]
MPLIEDLSRYGIEDRSYSPEAQKSNAYSTGFREKTIAMRSETDAREETPVLQARSHVFRSTWRPIGLATIESMLREKTRSFNCK